MRHFFAIILVAIAGALSAQGAVNAGDADPKLPVERLHGGLLHIMQNGQQLGFNARLRFITPRVEADFHFEAVARAVLGATWTSLDAEQRLAMRELMARLTAVTYAHRFAEFDNEAFTIVSAEPARGERQLVRAQMRRGTEIVARFDYVLERADDGWRIVNVIANGVSDLSLKRAEYSSVIRTDGFQVLRARIGQQITDLIENASTSG